jgi:hypothetical protein
MTFYRRTTLLTIVASIAFLSSGVHAQTSIESNTEDLPDAVTEDVSAMPLSGSTSGMEEDLTDTTTGKISLTKDGSSNGIDSFTEAKEEEASTSSSSAISGSDIEVDEKQGETEGILPSAKNDSNPSNTNTTGSNSAAAPSGSISGLVTGVVLVAVSVVVNFF